jgi:hypothetical protein
VDWAFGSLIEAGVWEDFKVSFPGEAAQFGDVYIAVICAPTIRGTCRS